MTFPSAHIVTVPGSGSVQRITGTTSQSSSALSIGKMATLIVSGDTAVAVRFSSGSDTAVSTDIEIPASGRFDWSVTTDSQIVSAIAADGTSTFECWVFESSP